jgi:mannose-6-phosphate isomerase
MDITQKRVPALRKMIETGDWEHLLRKKYVKTGDFVYVPSGQSML